MNIDNARRVTRRAWVWVSLLTLVVFFYPVEYQITRLLVLAGIVTTWMGALFLWWNRKAIRVVLVTAGMLPVIAVCLPGRPIDGDRLALDYSRGLRVFRGVRYVWGGEGWLGIDCSGLVRKGLVWGQIGHGLRELNGKPIRDGLALWWRDGSARALRDGFRGWTAELFRASSIAGTDHSRLKPGDLAVTADGIHVMAYLGNSTWIEADPNARKVIEVNLPTDILWFKVPVVFVRWRWLGPAVFP